MTFDFDAAHSAAHDQVWDALQHNDYIPALYALGTEVPALVDLCQWLVTEREVDPFQLARAVQAGSLQPWFLEFARDWADRRARQLRRQWRDDEELAFDAFRDVCAQPAFPALRWGA